MLGLALRGNKHGPVTFKVFFAFEARDSAALWVQFATYSAPAVINPQRTGSITAEKGRVWAACGQSGCVCVCVCDEFGLKGCESTSSGLLSPNAFSDLTFMLFCSNEGWQDKKKTKKKRNPGANPKR